MAPCTPKPRPHCARSQRARARNCENRQIESDVLPERRNRHRAADRQIKWLRSAERCDLDSALGTLEKNIKTELDSPRMHQLAATFGYASRVDRPLSTAAGRSNNLAHKQGWPQARLPRRPSGARPRRSTRARLPRWPARQSDCLSPPCSAHKLNRSSPAPSRRPARAMTGSRPRCRPPNPFPRLSAPAPMRP